MGGWLDLYHNIAVGSFHTKKLCSKLYSIEIEFYSKSFFEQCFGGRGVYALHLQLVGNPYSTAYLSQLNFSLSLTVETL